MPANLRLVAPRNIFRAAPLRPANAVLRARGYLKIGREKIDEIARAYRGATRVASTT
jgi:hypothetical protein